jgi:anti-anti-sigma regulatory factor
MAARAMKFRHDVAGDRVHVWLEGDLDGSNCNCLRAFWDCHIPEDASQVDVDMLEVDAIDGESIAHLVGIVRTHLASGAAIALRHAPQMLAHTLYKTGMLGNARLELIEPRSDEQHHT